MNSDYKINIPKPCFENWDAMTPNTLGKFCGSCQENVVDFTNKSAVEIQHYLMENRGKRVCGRFETSQLSSITIQIPQEVLWGQVHFHKMFLLALLIAMGTTLLSCADDKGNKQKIEKVEILEEKYIEESHRTTGIVLSHEIDFDADGNDTLIQEPSKTTLKSEEVQSVKPTLKVEEDAATKKKSQIKKPHQIVSTIGIVELHPKDSLKKSEN